LLVACVNYDVVIFVMWLLYVQLVCCDCLCIYLLYLHCLSMLFYAVYLVLCVRSDNKQTILEFTQCILSSSVLFILSRCPVSRGLVNAAPGPPD